MMSWLNDLEKIIEDLPTRAPQAQFRLWLSSAPHPKFPIGARGLGRRAAWPALTPRTARSQASFRKVSR